MSYDFDGSSDRLHMTIPSSIGADGVPFTIAAWFYRDTSTGNDVIGAVGGGASGGVNSLRMASNNDSIALTWTGSQYAQAAAAHFHSDATWHHSGGAWAAADSREVWSAGSNYGSEGSSRALTDADEISIGAEITVDYFDGKIAEVGVWDRGMTTREMETLAAGFSPSLS